MAFKRPTGAKKRQRKPVASSRSQMPKRDPKAWRKKANKQGGGKSPAIAKVRSIRKPTSTGSKRGKGTLKSRR